ncbi:hypothetical protein D9758_018132 [Tetrapyrgos nigripes]|uniref:Carboxylic ester hydrolase n=1 Tax=Tetrapyrgos nigripes TaxID=182062 RepID=A0A8H5C4G4_9AGAR|nr:hypothetical protein D9758_018132 [Tetrapyrgos nigripes]
MRLPLLLLAFELPFLVTGSAPTAVIGDVTFTGRRTSDNVEFFGGIPFAEPPVADLRLKPPVPKMFSSGQQATFNATQFGPSCVQTKLPPEQLSEDCLSLNIFRPSNISSDKSLPVMVWVYGGGFIVGSSSRYDGTPLVNRSVSRGTPTILVTVNYRLGPLGFPRGEEVFRDAEAGSHILNLGLQDNVAALQWVQENIASFGGDPSKVTVFGESSGARALELLILNGEIEGLARGVIIESTARIPDVIPQSPAANETWNNFMSALPNCVNSSLSDIECIRNLTTADLINGYNDAGIFFSFAEASEWTPTFGDRHLPGMPSTLMPKKKVVEAVLIGTNKDEGTLATNQSVNTDQVIKDTILGSPPSPPNATQSEREAQLNKLESILNKTLALYPNIPSKGSPFDTGNETFGLDPQYKRTAAVATDYVYNSERRYHINNQLLPAGISTYSYLFTDPDAVPMRDFVVGTPVPGSLGVSHTSEVYYVFGIISEQPEVPEVTPTAAKLSDMMMDYWISFADTLNPNDAAGSDRPEWPEYTTYNPILLELNGHNTTVVLDNLRESQVALFVDDPTVLGYR